MVGGTILSALVLLVIHIQKGRCTGFVAAIGKALSQKARIKCRLLEYGYWVFLSTTVLGIASLAYRKLMSDIAE